MTVFQKVRGWIGLLFSVGIDGPQLAWDSTADAAADRLKVLRGDQTVETAVVYANVAGLDPELAQDFVTLTYADTNYADINDAASNTLKSIEIPFTDADIASTKSSTESLPAGAVISRCTVRIDTAFAADVDLSVGSTSDGATQYAAPADTRLDKVGTYDIPLYEAHGGAGAEKVDATFGAGGAGTALGALVIYYSVPNA